MAAAEETGQDWMVFSQIKKEHKNCAEGFSQWSTCFPLKARLGFLHGQVQGHEATHNRDTETWICDATLASRTLATLPMRQA